MISVFCPIEEEERELRHGGSQEIIGVGGFGEDRHFVRRLHIVALRIRFQWVGAAREETVAEGRTESPNIARLTENEHVITADKHFPCFFGNGEFLRLIDNFIHSGNDSAVFIGVVGSPKIDASVFGACQNGKCRTFDFHHVIEKVQFDQFRGIIFRFSSRHITPLAGVIQLSAFRKQNEPNAAPPLVESKTNQAHIPGGLDETRRAVCTALLAGEADFDALCAASRLESDELGALLIEMEMDGLVTPLAGTRYAPGPQMMD